MSQLLRTSPFHVACLVACLAASACASTPSSVRNVQSSQADDLVSAFDRVVGSVVTIHTVGKTGLVDEQGAVSTASGVGSGVLISQVGDILTAAHVVQTADDVQVEFSDGARIPASVISSQPEADLALVRLKNPVPSGVVPAALGNSDDLRIGSRVFVVGAPLGISHTLTVGHISARRQIDSPLGTQVKLEFFQTDASINKGNSGGPMFDMNGRVMGIVSYIVSQSGGSQGLGFAVTANTARSQIIERPRVWSGMDYAYLDGAIAAALNLPQGRPGLLVQRVAKGSAGERMGIQGGHIPATIAERKVLLGGDVILEVFGLEIESPATLGEIRDLQEGFESADRVTVVVLRGGKLVRLERTWGTLLVGG